MEVLPGKIVIKRIHHNAEGDLGLIPGYGKIPWRKEWNPFQYSCLGIHGWMSLTGYTAVGSKESVTTERLSTQIEVDNTTTLFYISLSFCS